MPVMMPSVGMNPQMMAMMGGGMPAGMQMMPMGNGVQAVMMPMQMDKGQQPGQSGIPGLGGMTQMSMGALTGMPNMAGMNMIPMMMGGTAGSTGMPQGFMMPMMQQQSSTSQSSDKGKQNEADKQKSSMEKKEDKKESFPPQAMPMQSIDLSKMGMIQMPGGAIGMLPNGQMGSMQMPQMMQGMGMGGMGGMLGGSGMPQGILMNPMMMQQQKQGN